MEGRCRSTTSTAWTGLVLIGLSSSRGSGKVLPVKTSCSKCQLTRETNFIDTLKGRSFPPSPGSVTSKSTWAGEKERSKKHLFNLESGSLEIPLLHITGPKTQKFRYWSHSTSDESTLSNAQSEENWALTKRKRIEQLFVTSNHKAIHSRKTLACFFSSSQDHVLQSVKWNVVIDFAVESSY